MSTLRISNIEAKSVPASATIDEKVKITNSSGDVLVFLDGKTSGITTVGINTTDGNITFDANSNVVVTGIITATKFSGQFEPTSVGIADSIFHRGDDNTSINFPSADTIRFDTAGSNRLTIGSNGYVNIGTGSAEQQLTVQNSAQHSLIRVISKNDSDAGIDFGDVDDTDRARIRYSNPTDSLSLNVNADTRVVIDSSGRVMIGGGSSPSQVGDGQLIVYSSDRLHPAIKCAGMINNYANGYSMLADNYTATESQMSLGLSYSSSALVLSRGVKVSGSQDDVYLSSQAQYATRPCAIRLDQYGNFIFLTTETNAATTVDTAVTLTNRFQIDRSGNIYQKPSGRNMYFGSGNNLRIGVQSNGDSNIEAVSGDLKFMDGGNVIFQMRSDGLEMKRDIYFGTAGNGIVLGNTSNVDANTLDDYEEGSFTPFIRTANNTTEPSYSHRVGLYTKVGRLVTYAIRITTSGELSTGSGATQIHGLPFNAMNWNIGDWPGGAEIAYYSNLRGNYGTNPRLLGPYNNNTYIRFHTFNAQTDTGNNAYNHIFTNNTVMIIYGQYFAA